MPMRVTINLLRILQYLLEHDQDTYALEIARATGLSNGALFPALKNLQDAGHLISDLEDIDESLEGRRKRRYFKLTSQGRDFAEEQLRAAPTLPATSKPAQSFGNKGQVTV